MHRKIYTNLDVQIAKTGVSLIEHQNEFKFLDLQHFSLLDVVLIKIYLKFDMHSMKINCVDPLK